MKGIVFNLLESFVTESFCSTTWENIQNTSKLETKVPFVEPKAYPDADMLKLLGTAENLLEIRFPILLQLFGKHCFPLLIKRYPEYIEDINTPNDFVEKIDDIIHLEVKKAQPGSYTPIISAIELEDGTLDIEYQSDRKLCAFLEGLLMGCAFHFKYNIEIKHDRCMHKDHDHCHFKVTFTPKN